MATDLDLGYGMYFLPCTIWEEPCGREAPTVIPQNAGHIYMVLRRGIPDLRSGGNNTCFATGLMSEFITLFDILTQLPIHPHI